MNPTKSAPLLRLVVGIASVAQLISSGMASGNPTTSSTPFKNTALAQTSKEALDGFSTQYASPSPPVASIRSNEPQAEAPKPKSVTVNYSVDKLMFSNLIATVGEQIYLIIDEREELCLSVTDARDYDQDGHTDALVTHIAACGGNAAGDSFLFISYKGGGIFQRSHEFGSNCSDDPKIELWKNTWSVVITSTNAGVNTDLPVKKTERYILRNGIAIKVEESVTSTKELPAIAEIRSKEFDLPESNESEVKYLLFDLNRDGVKDMIECKYWARWGLLRCKVVGANGKAVSAEIQAKRVGILKSTTKGWHDIVCDFDSVFQWDGNEYAPRAATK